MKISNVTILNTNLTNNTAKISFTISEATENVNIYLKINDEEYKKIFSNKTNETLEYIANVSRGVNNLLLKATDSTTEYISEPIQVLLKEAPSIKNLECSYSDSTGKYILNFAFNGDINFKYNIYLKLDTNDYIEALSNQISGDKTIEQTSTMGEHTCILKVSDGYDDYTFSSFQFEITNRKPILSKVLVTDITNSGEAYIHYSTKDIESSALTHKLAIGTTETVITPTQVDNFYSYKITGLSEGTSNCMISISDGLDTVSSDVFSIEVFSNTTDKKELLRRAKVRYDSAYQQLRDIIVSVISDLKYDYDIENALIAKAQDNYKIEYSNFNKISQQSIDTIGTNKVNVTRQDLETQINDVDNAVDTLETTMNGVFKDGILDESEKKILEENLNLVAKEKVDVDRDYETLYNNEDLLDPAKTKLQTKYNDFTTAHTTLVTTVNNIINKTGIIDNTDKSNIDTAFENWRVALGDYRNASLEAIDSIAKKKADDSADVVDKKWAEIILDPDTGIQAQVGSLSTTVDGFDERISNVEMTADSINSTVSSIQNTVGGFDERISNVEITANGVSSTVSSMQNTVNGFDNRISTNESNITQLSDKITSTVMTEDDVKSVIEQNSSSVKIGFNGISDSVVINSSGLTVNQGSIACDSITSCSKNAIIKLFEGNDLNMAIDATVQYETGIGDAIRLKRDDNNYIRIGNQNIQFYIGGGGDNETPLATFTADTGGEYFKMTTKGGTLTLNKGLGRINGVGISMDGHTHNYASSSHSHSGEYAPISHPHSSISYGSSTSIDCYSSTMYMKASSTIYVSDCDIVGENGSENCGTYSKPWRSVVADMLIYLSYCGKADGDEENLTDANVSYNFMKQYNNIISSKQQLNQTISILNTEEQNEIFEEEDEMQKAVAEKANAIYEYDEEGINLFTNASVLTETMAQTIEILINKVEELEKTVLDLQNKLGE